MNCKSELFEGCLRFFKEPPEWIGLLSSFPSDDLHPFAEDAFGNVYCLDGEGRAAIYWPETAQVDHLEMCLDEFVAAISLDPEGTISAETYKSACCLLGKPTDQEHFAMIVELSLGGSFNPENMRIVSSGEHGKALDALASQIKKDPAGTVYKIN